MIGLALYAFTGSALCLFYAAADAPFATETPQGLRLLAHNDAKQDSAEVSRGRDGESFIHFGGNL